jgi:hypothetical protein
MKYSLILLATFVLFSGCGDSACCNSDQTSVQVLGKPVTKVDPVIDPDPVVPVLKKPTAVITPQECDGINARWFTCIDSKDNDTIDPTPDIGISETSITKCDWTIKVFSFDKDPVLVSEYSSYTIFDENGEVDPESTSTLPRWIGHDGGYKVIELTVTDDDGQKSDTVVKKYNFELGECGELEDL